MKNLIFSLLITVASSNLLAAGTCRPLDLSNQIYAPFRNQIYFEQTRQKDSQFCHAMALANLVGQATGVAISPDDISYQAAQDDFYNEGIGELPFDIELPGYLQHDWQAMIKIGFCPQSDINALLQKRFRLASQQATYMSSQKLHDLGATQDHWTVDDMANSLKKVCKNRIQLPQAQIENIKFSQNKDIKLLQTKIDATLDSGRYIALLYNGHYVTVVGRTSDCSYLVQDSIPRSFWMGHEFEKTQTVFTEHGGAIEFLDEHLQRWPADTLYYAADEIDILNN